MSAGSKPGACPGEETIVLFIAGGLERSDEARVRAHANGCDACRALLADAARNDASYVPATRHQHLRAREGSGARSPLAGKYVLEEELGAGGMGRVFMGRHVALDRPVAIKLIHVELLSDSTVVKRFEREARAAAALKSKHVVQILDIDYLPSGAPFIVMEYLDGCDLADLLRKQDAPLGLAEAVGYVLQACDALAEAHARGIVHRDLKPHNLFLARVEGGEPIVKVLDFGLAKRLSGSPGRHSSDSMTAQGGVIGTPHFMSPEQIRSAPEIDHRTDIWSIGATLYQLVSGRPPFAAPNFHMLRARMLREEPAPLSRLRADVPPALDAIVLQCLQKDPARRWQNVEAFVTALRSIMPQLAAAGPPATQRTGPGSQPTLDMSDRSAEVTGRGDLTGSLDGRTLIDAPASEEGSPATVKMPDVGEGPPKTRRA